MSVYCKEKPEYLKQSIESILMQTYPTDDFVIVEDGKLTKELDQVLEQYSTNNSCIHLIKNEKNKGLGAALNQGIKSCKNELVARMDSDDISLPTRCERELKKFNENKQLDIVGSSIIKMSEDMKTIICIKNMPTSQEDIYKYAARRNPFNHPTVMYKKACVINNGGYSETRRGEDFRLFTQMVFQGAKCFNINEPLLKYRAADNQFERRTSWQDTKAVLGVINDNFHNGYINLFDYFSVVILQLGAFVIPNKFGIFLYNRLFSNHKNS